MRIEGIAFFFFYLLLSKSFHERKLGSVNFCILFVVSIYVTLTNFNVNIDKVLLSVRYIVIHKSSYLTHEFFGVNSVPVHRHLFIFTLFSDNCRK